MAIDARERLRISNEALAEFCRNWKISELAIFGSALREDFRSESDIDLLVTFEPDAQWSLIDHVRMEGEMSSLLSRKVDMVTRRSIERSRNPFRKREILASATTIYATAA